jgi:hypothetical protein
MGVGGHSLSALYFFTRSLGEMATDERRNHLLLVLDHLVSVWNEWAENADVRYVTEKFEQAMNDALGVFADGAIPGDMRGLNARMDVLREHWDAWNKQNEVSGGKNPIPNNAFWHALEAVESGRQAIVKPIRRALESIADLTAQKVPDAQICRIYGFTNDGTPRGNPELWKLQEERAKPGCHTSKGWLPPWEKKAQADAAKEAEIVERIKRQREGKLRLIASVAPESIEDLIAQGVSGKQICRMKKIDEAELATYCEDHGLTTPNWQGESPNAMVGVHDYVEDEEPAERPPMSLDGESVTEATEQVADEPLTLEQEIIMYHKLGTMTPTQIAASVSREGSEISRQKVNAVVKRWEAEPSAFDTVGV